MPFASRAPRLPRSWPASTRRAFSKATNPHTRCAPNSCLHQRGVANPIRRPSRRGIVTSSLPPTAFIERPEALVLAESRLYRHSWEGAAANFFPARAGMHFANIDLMRSRSSEQVGDAGDIADAPSLKMLEQTLADDLSHLGDTADVGDAEAYLPGHAPPTTASAHVVLVARGPLQCLVAQYFVESLPLAGLVLVDPLLLPEDGRAGKKKSEGENRWKQSLLDCMSMLNAEDAPQSAASGNMSPPLMLPDDNTKKEQSSEEFELSILQSLANEEASETARPLRLEPGSIPLLILYSGDHVYHDHYRICAERTAAFHTCGGSGDYFDQVSVLKVKTRMEGDGPVDDVDWAMKSIYEWYDEVVA